MTSQDQLVRGFGRYDSGTSTIYWPTTVNEANQVFQIAKKQKKRVVIRGGGHSFHGQAVPDFNGNPNDLNQYIILSTDFFEPGRIEFDPGGAHKVTLGSGVRWLSYVDHAIDRATNNTPILIPASMQTGGQATAGGTASGDCLSRFSCTTGKESASIDSLRILTPSCPTPLNASKTENPDLFHAVIGGLGYLGLVTDVTYNLIPVALGKCAFTEVTTHTSVHDLIQKQLELIRNATPPLAVSSAWFAFPWLDFWRKFDPGKLRGAVFQSSYQKPSDPQRDGFPLYRDPGPIRYYAEVWARHPLPDTLVDTILYLYVHFCKKFDDNLADFLFFMDGDAQAREKYEQKHYPQLFPIVQQTYVVSVDKTEDFTKNCLTKIHDRKLHATDCDMLYVLSDECLMSGNYHLPGFAVSFAFESTNSIGPPAQIIDLLRELSVDCLNAGGRIHLTKNSHVDKQVFRKMFSPQIEQFEKIKRQYDPELLIQNPFSDKFFNFQGYATAVQPPN